MSDITLVTYLVSEDEFAYSHVADLALVQVEGSQILYSTTGPDGVIRGWNISGEIPLLIEDFAFEGAPVLGGTTSLATLNTGGVISMISSGGPEGGIQITTLTNEGEFGAGTFVADLTFSGIQNFTTVTLKTGGQVIYGGLAASQGIGQITFDANGAVVANTTTVGPAGSFTDQISATAYANVEGQQFLLTTSITGDGVASWKIDDDGTLFPAENLGVDQGLWIDTPTVMQTAVVGGQTYILLGAAESGSITVLQLNADGNMIIKDHVLDTLDTRFNGISALEVIHHNGQTFVIAGGSDDGITIFTLLEGGQLLPRAHIADTTEMGLDNISAIAVASNGNALDVYVTSSSEIGITKLRYDTGSKGITTTATIAGGSLFGSIEADILSGYDGDDVIDSSAGDDILRDGRGTDTMTGGMGADVFILSVDGQSDTITDFTLGEDTIDLSRWPMLRDVSQLTMKMLPEGVEIGYGDEILVVLSSDGAPIDYRQFTNSDLIGITRIPQNTTPGYPGPATPPPDLTPPPIAQDTSPNNMMAGVGLIANENSVDLHAAFGEASDQEPTTPNPEGEVILGQAGADTLSGGAGSDVIIAGAGNDVLNGGEGADTLLGRDGNDRILGNEGADILIGGAGADTLLGGSGQDILRGGSGNDIIDGGAGNDVLFGGAGADEFIFSGGHDVITDYTQGEDYITLTAAVWIGLTSAEDLLMMYGRLEGTQMTIDFGDGDTLVIENITDPSALAHDIDLF
ncbi:calcium-binding protein [Yoonia maritima]|uniref:calcium-binding protein n=1 Tax=Yoonia maritima TaxID=1435347 RepID=UPI003735CC3E